MRSISKRSTFDKMNKEILTVSFIFMVFVVIGACINKVYPNAQSSLLSNISGTVDYYSSSINFKNMLMSNFKVDMLFLCGMVICTATVFLLPVSIIMFIFKGLSIGYVINSLVLGLKMKSIKIVLITLTKCLIVLPGALILAILSAKYIFEMINEIKRNHKSNIAFLVKRYCLNASIIITITLSVQLITNAISIATLQLLF